MKDIPNVSSVAASNFLIPVDQVESDRDFMSACVESLKDFNPMVHVAIEEGTSRQTYYFLSGSEIDFLSFTFHAGRLAEKSGDFLNNFDVVVVGRSLLKYRVSSLLPF